MGRPAKVLELACAGCGARASLGAPAAKRAGWDLWFGGCRCPACSAAMFQPARSRAQGAPAGAARSTTPSLSRRGGAPLASLARPARASGELLAAPEPSLIRCAACGRTFANGLERTDGWRTPPHWSPTPEQVAAYHERRVRVPLCPGWKLTAVAVPIPGTPA